METQIVSDVTLNGIELGVVGLENPDDLQKCKGREYFLEELECAGLEMEEEILEVDSNMCTSILRL